MDANKPSNSEIENVRRTAGIEATKESLIKHVEGRLSQKARIMFAGVVQLVVVDAISSSAAREIVLRINDYNRDPSPEKEDEIYAKFPDDAPVRAELSDFEEGLLSDLESLQKRNLLRNSVSAHARHALLRLRKPLTREMVSQYLSALVKHEGCSVESPDFQAVIAKYK